MNCPDCAKLDDGRCCDRAVVDCPDKRRAAIDAGIPASVIRGEKRLDEVLSREVIDLMCGVPVRQ